MPRAVLLDDEVRAFLERQRVGHLATADLRARPHVVPIVYALRGDTLYSVIDRKPKRRPPTDLRRVRNLTANPQAAVVIDAYEEDWSRLGYVLLEGRAEIIWQGPEHDEAVRLLRERYPQYEAMELDDRPVIAMRLERVVRWGKVG